jgi:hypothetical protein
MSGDLRTVLGHAVMRLGLGVRRLSLPLCLLAGVVLGAWALFQVASGRDTGLPSLVALGLGLVALALGLRLLAFATGALGWLLLPADHREMLGRLTGSPPTFAGGDDDDERPPDPSARLTATPLEHEAELPGRLAQAVR